MSALTQPRALWLLSVLIVLSTLAIDWQRLNKHATRASGLSTASAAPNASVLTD